jgi:hypothetical protein
MKGHVKNYSWGNVLRGWEVGAADSESCPVVTFSIGVAESLCSAARKLLHIQPRNFCLICYLVLCLYSWKKKT